MREPHVRCRDFAVTAMSLAVQLFTADRMESLNLPERQKDSVQPDSTSCGLHVVFWAEQEYRRLRGDGAVQGELPAHNEGKHLAGILHHLHEAEKADLASSRFCSSAACPSTAW